MSRGVLLKTAWAAKGHSSAEAWLGEETGAGFGAARATLRASEKLDVLPGLNDAARSGDLSDLQLKELSDAATADNEQELLDQARRGSTDQLRKACKQAKAEGARLDARVAATANTVFTEAWKQGRRDSSGAYRLDALLRLALRSDGR